MKINLKEIRIDGGTQNRELINDSTVTEYTEMLLDGTTFPPVEVFDDGVSKWLVDGFHRYFAHSRAGLKEIEVSIHKGTRRDAQFYSLGVNDKHGLQRTNADKRKAVMIALDDIEWQDLSDSQLARVCRVTQPFVSKLRKSLQIARPVEKTITRGGKEFTMDTGNIGKIKEFDPIPEVAILKPLESMPEVEEYTDKDRISELSEINQQMHEENLSLHDKMTVLSEDQEKINNQFSVLRSTIKALEAELVAVKSSRDQYQAKNAELIKQVNYWKKRAEKVAS